MNKKIIVKEKVTKAVYIIKCPICFEKREVSYYAVSNLHHGNIHGYCKLCSPIMQAKTKLDKRDDSKQVDLLRCTVCNLNIKMTSDYKYFMIKKFGNNFICIDCQIAKRKSYREENELNGLSIKSVKPKVQIKLFGCILQEERNCRCSLGRRCKHYLDCLDATIDLDWDGFTAVGPGHPKDYDWQL